MPRTHLFSDLTLRDVRIKNRVMVSPMWQYCGKDGFPTDWHLMNLGRLADGGAGLVFQEGTTIERRACGSPGDIGIWNDGFVPAYSRIVSLIRANGATPGIQLMHAGRKARQKAPFMGRGPLERTPDIKDWDDWEVIGPSAIPQSPGFPVPREMTLADIQAVTEAWIAGARRANEAGYDVLDIHAAHGYLLHQFMSPVSNQRTDAYGGDFNNRIRFTMQVIEGIRSVWPQGKPLFVRLSCIDDAGWTIEDSIALVKLMAKAGVDLIDCSAGGITGSPLATSLPIKYGYQVGLAATIRRETGVPTSAVGLIVHAEHAEQILAEGSADMIALGRELIYNPNWPMDAAQKLGDEAGFAVMQHRSSFWLERRAATVPQFKPSTFA